MAVPFNVLKGIRSPKRYTGPTRLVHVNNPFPPAPWTVTGSYGAGGQSSRLPGDRGPAVIGGTNTRDTTPNRGTGKLAPLAASANPWDSYLASIDAREQALMERMLRSQQQSSRDYMGALQGFGGAISGSVADAWGRALGGYERAADATGAFQGAAKDDYTLGLEAANNQIARDFANFGQAGPADIRDTAAAANQVGTVGGENPAGVTGLVGESWRNYAGTVPGNLDFMTKQNIAQAGREGLIAEDKIRSDFLQLAQDNPEQAMAMWQAAQQYEWTKEDRGIAAQDRKLATVAAAAKASQEARAFELQVRAFNLKYGAEMADQAASLAKTTGTVWVYNPKTNQMEDTGRQTESGRVADQRNDATLRGQDITAESASNNRIQRAESQRLNRLLRERGLDLEQQRIDKQEDALATGKISTQQLRLWGQRAGKAAMLGFMGQKDKNGDLIEGSKMQAEEVLRGLRAQQVPLSIALDAIAQYAWSSNDKRWAYARSWRRLNMPKVPTLSQGATNSPG